MPGDLRRVYWDACVPLSHINAIPDRLPIIEELFRKARAGEFELLTSVLSRVEVAFAATEQQTGSLDPVVEARIDDLWRPGSPIKLVEFYDLIAQSARELMRQGI